MTVRRPCKVTWRPKRGQVWGGRTAATNPNPQQATRVTAVSPIVTASPALSAALEAISKL